MSGAPLRLGTRTFGPDELVVMAVVNRTPDSFFTRGATYAEEAALEAVDAAVAGGAAIVDIGGVKAGYGDVVSAEEESRRVVGFVGRVRERHPDVVISVDTWRADVGDAVARAGADLLNDAWGGHEPGLLEVAARHGVGYVCTHTAGLPPRTDPHRPAFDDVVADVRDALVALAQRAEAAGVRSDGIVIDPAHDFGKATRHSLAVTRRLDELTGLGWPVLVALSRKDFVGESLDLPADERLEGTLAATAVSAWLGARIFRAHDVVATRRVLDMVGCIRGTQQPAVVRRGMA
ncbi:dihydropteroate synthase [Motilibacter rhizosphaerae]|uniref:Inactive dihydropteroate synthase 2 n=1 Tax=Motilibacter rhizosphaerae TaxID=598652 RepID=A0A4Q7NPY1_9ACTN|nr:dihydropteroate synthase [Motilibacter rhizosphaerae]RZS87253.1 dihydropteroate synthase [Motilibacter rhizosphaerae]